MTVDFSLSSPGRQFAAFALTLTVIRILALVFAHADLGPDEGQYWYWSRDLAFGYFSKPPVIAWSIAATTALFGDSEWAVRLSAPLYQAGAATFLFLLCRRLCDARAGLIAGVAWLTLPGVFLSSALISTDAPLTFFWCAALYFFFMLTDRDDRNDKRLIAALLGAAIGFGFMSKYAMSYFIPGAALAFAFSAARLRVAGAFNLALVGLVAFLIVLPNILWNADNDFQTIAHTAANANWKGPLGHPDQLADFLIAQIGVAGPIMLALIAVSGLRRRRSERGATLALLFAFSIPPFLIVCAQAFIARAHGNWAAVAYPSAIAAASIFVANFPRAMPWMKASLALHLVVGAGFLVALVNADFARAVGAGPAFKRLTGWSELGAVIARESAAFDVILTDDREITGELVYYARAGKPVVTFDSNHHIDNHFEAFDHYDRVAAPRALYVTSAADGYVAREFYRTIRPIGPISVKIDAGRVRTLYLFEVGDPAP